MRFARIFATSGALLAGSLYLAPAEAAGLIGKTAPAFVLPDSAAHSVALADYRGKFVVLEWTNDGCPFVQHYYSQGAMQSLQGDYTAKGVIWLTIISSAPGKQGYLTGLQADQLTHSRNAHPSAVLLDSSGMVGHLYAARTTPDMVIIDRSGKVVYAGAIDSIPSTDPADIPRASPYLKAALDQAMSGQTVAIPSTPSYGCSIKY
jgi:hypothetical protein